MSRTVLRDPDSFFNAIGPRLQIVRLDSTKPAVLIGSTFDRQTLLKLVEQRLGRHPKTEELDAEVHVGSDGWSFAFAGPHFLTGPADSVRRCLEAKVERKSVTDKAPFNRARANVDLSFPIVSLTFSHDGSSAISFIELFSSQERSAFSTNAAAIQQGAAALPYAASVTTMGDDAIEWSSRSSFGLLGSLVRTFVPERDSLMELLVATGNVGKLREIQALLAEAPITLVTLADFPESKLFPKTEQHSLRTPR